MIALNIAVIAMIGYLLGSMPTSIWLSKLAYGIDIREHGSGNAGGTNVFRTLGWKPGVFVALVDIAKGFVATVYGSAVIFSDMPLDMVYLQLIAGIAATMGHVWTLFAGFRGGKGVATLAGMLLGLFPTIVPFCLLVFFITVFTTRYVSLSSMLAALTLPTGLLVVRFGFHKPVPNILMAIGFLLAAFILFTHRTNIKRLLAGTESKISTKPTHQAEKG